MPIVCFFGTDGSGKTTLAGALAKRYNNNGCKVKLSWMRGTHTLASFLAKLLSNFNVFRGPNNPYYKIKIPKNLKRIWQLVEFVSIIPIVGLKFVLPSILGYWVVAERYTPDFVTWVSITTNDQQYSEKLEAKFLLVLSSKAQAKIYVTATLQELSRRRKETNLEFVRAQLTIYDRLASVINARRLDTTNKSASESVEEILSLLEIE